MELASQLMSILLTFTGPAFASGLSHIPYVASDADKSMICRQWDNLPRNMLSCIS
jgi:hypothetical protein